MTQIRSFTPPLLLAKFGHSFILTVPRKIGCERYRRPQITPSMALNRTTPLGIHLRCDGVEEAARRCAKTISRPGALPASSRESFTSKRVAFAAAGARRIRGASKHFGFVANDVFSRTIGRQQLSRSGPARTSGPAIPPARLVVVRFDGPHAAALLTDQRVRKRLAARTHFQTFSRPFPLPNFRRSFISAK